MFSSKSPFVPDPHLLTDFLRHQRHRRIVNRTERGASYQWSLLLGRTNKEWLLHPQPANLRKVLPPGDRFWADPFLWRQGDRWCIFCEEWFFNKPHAHISVLHVSPEGQLLAPAQPVLVKDHHLSYPFLFEHEGALLMLPEGGAGKELDLYQCEEFPGRWRKRATLMRNIQYADATLLAYEAKWWLFLTIKRGLFRLNRDLFVFWSDTPVSGHWHPHPANPVVRGLQSARSAGRFFQQDGKLFRPSQNCLVRYGHSLRINEVLRLDTRGYQERLVRELTPDWEGGLCGNHHIDWHDGMVAMDAQKVLPARGAAT